MRVYLSLSLYIYIYIYVVSKAAERAAAEHNSKADGTICVYGHFSKSHVRFCGLDPGNLKFETVRTHRQHICFKDLRHSI